MSGDRDTISNVNRLSVFGKRTVASIWESQFESELHNNFVLKFVKKS
jgi:uncharacterized LabA/DUF88 family protein